MKPCQASPHHQRAEAEAEHPGNPPLVTLSFFSKVASRWFQLLQPFSDFANLPPHHKGMIEGYSSSSPASPSQRGPELSAAQATFLAGAAVTHAHHASGFALGAATLAHQAAEREQQTVAQAREAVMQANVQAAAEAQLRGEAQSIARAAQGIVDDARHREASLRQEAQSAIEATNREAQQRVSAIQGEAQQAIAQHNQSGQARIRLVEGEAQGLSEALRQANAARERAEFERQAAQQHSRQRDADLLIKVGN